MKIRFPSAVAVFALALASCGDDAGENAPGAVPPTIRKPAATSKFDGVRVAHILIAKDGKGRREPKIRRTREDALALAKSLLADIKGGRDFLEVAGKFSEDVDGANKLNSNCGEPGVYEGAQIEGFDPAWKDAAFKTPAGTVAAEPVESESYGFFLIKRIK